MLLPQVSVVHAALAARSADLVQDTTWIHHVAILVLRMVALVSAMDLQHAEGVVRAVQVPIS